MPDQTRGQRIGFPPGLRMIIAATSPAAPRSNCTSVPVVRTKNCDPEEQPTRVVCRMFACCKISSLNYELRFLYLQDEVWALTRRMK